MENEIYKPEGYLKKYIKLIWFMEINVSAENCICDKLVPGGSIEIIINIGEKLTIKGKKNRENLTASGMVGGQKTTFSEFIPGSRGIISVILQPESAFSVLGIPVNEISDLYVEPVDIWKEDGEVLVDQISEAKSFKKRVQILERFLTERIKKNESGIDDRIKFGVDLISQSGGNININYLSEKLCLSKRQCERIFVKNIGLTPKEFSKIVRFQWLLFNKQKNINISNTELAYIAGYFDQAHFNNDFKNITGLTPTEYFSLGEVFSDFYSF